MTNPIPTRAEVEALKMRPVRRKHVFHGPGDHANSWESDSCQACVLSLCKVCQGAEASLPTDCPGRKMTCEEEDAVQNGTLDFVRDCWVVPRAYAATLVPQAAPEGKPDFEKEAREFVKSFDLGSGITFSEIGNDETECAVKFAVAFAERIWTAARATAPRKEGSDAR